MRHLLKQLKDCFYDIMVRRVPEIQQYYEGFVNAHKEQHQKARLKSWLILFQCNLQYYLFHKLPDDNFKREETKKLYLGGSESSLSVKPSCEEAAELLSGYDVVTFDLFDTLVLRPFRSPADLFYLVGMKLNYLNFKNLRVTAEQEARKIKFQREKTYEVTLREIYDYMEQYMGIDSQRGMEAEMETEISLCQPNPYLKEIYHLLFARGQKMAVVSDMYLPKTVLRKILDSCGYTQLTEIFVSCEERVSKHEGGLFSLVKQHFGGEKRYIHMGDNPKADVDSAKRQGFEAVYYENVEKGNAYRPALMSPIIGSAYAGIVNGKLHNGRKVFSLPYEYGYVYGGLFALGYCEFIHRFYESHQLDKILFLSRDGDILSKVYEKRYPSDRTEYVYWSRLAAVKLAARNYKYDYLERFVDHNSHSGLRIGNLIEGMELDSIKDKLCQKAGISLEEELTPQNAASVKTALISLWDQVLQCYQDARKGAGKYYGEVLKNCSKVCAVDVGWAGSGAAALSYLVQEEWGMPCQVFGLLAGTNTVFNSAPDASEGFLQNGSMKSYLYSASKNRELYLTHNPGKKHNVYFEMLLSSNQRSLKGFGLKKDGTVRLDFSQPEPIDSGLIDEIQQGILDFSEDYSRIFAGEPAMFGISGSDAYAPFRLAVSNREQYFQSVLKELKFKENIL